MPDAGQTRDEWLLLTAAVRNNGCGCRYLAGMRVGDACAVCGSLLESLDTVAMLLLLRRSLGARMNRAVYRDAKEAC